MKFRSILDPGTLYSAKQAIVDGIAPDGSLFVPVEIPRLPESVIRSLHSLSFNQLAVETSALFLGSEIPRQTLSLLIDQAFNFDAPLVQIEERVYSLELFHGPTLAFKDFGARFMASILSYFNRDNSAELTILVATSGDTGSAVANGFFNRPGVRVVILYPSGKISQIQEQQITTLGGNVVACEIAGTFDDCQRLVKEAFQNDKLRRQVNLTSANSINIARLIPQVFYYLRAIGQLKGTRDLVVSVPSGNFGNLTAGVLAKLIGAPIARFTAALNANDVFQKFLISGDFTPRPSVTTLSNSMDVGNPSNLARIQYLFDGSIDRIRALITAHRISDKETIEAISKVFSSSGYILDPHGAVGYLGLQRELKNSPDAQGIFLETAHPAKFPDALPSNVRAALKIPESLERQMQLQKQSVKLEASLEALQELFSSRSFR